ncbi:DNA-directed RNA polymerase I subunit RPA2 [Diaphorina citri]|uniref:DNA-directed RNA polymerase n=1 Tax=Diaphorina citri TaxID=121845 RepID=A0A3Q0ITX4_DIACI|nr:DNA-directed RNA polymerase I subunit RPA2 [Diaphorina citri]
MILNQNTLSAPSLKNLTDKNFGKPPDKQNEFLLTLGAPHIASFDFMLDEGLDLAVEDIAPIEFEIYGKTLKLNIVKAAISEPKVPAGPVGIHFNKYYPTEARQTRSVYSGPFNVTVAWSWDGKAGGTFTKEVGRVPIMLKSKRCHLRNLTPAQLIERGEHPDEWGGYFIVGGHEKLVRLLINNRRNHPIAIKRNAWKNRGLLFSDLGVYIRSVKRDESATNNVLHFVTNGSARFMFSHRKSMYFAPVILIFKCLVDKSDEYIFQHLMRGNKTDQYFKVCLLGMMQSLHEEGIHTQHDSKVFFGQIFKEKLQYDLRHLNEVEICDYMLTNCILPHLDDYWDKFLCLSHMTCKLFHVVQGMVQLDSEDSIMLQEIMTGGSLYLQILKDKLIGLLVSAKLQLLKKEKSGTSAVLKESDIYAAFRASSIESAMTNFLATGNVSAGKNSTLQLMQASGFVIMAENINRMRYMSHFRAVHRGSYFQEMRSSEPRQLRTDAWGFICPVHTPDGTPCGLLNHLTTNCQISEYIPSKVLAQIPSVLVSLGMLPLTPVIQSIPEQALMVMLDGRIVGYILDQIATSLVPKLRMLKIVGEKIPKSLEIVYLKRPEKGMGLYPGLYLFTGPGRMLRPVMNLAAGNIEWIGTFEQVFMDICITMKEAYPGITTHRELSKTDFLSNLANLIPMPDCNQSPRNMYQCQMGKQTMGTPCLNWRYQGVGKLYRLQTPASPFFRPVHYDTLDMDNFPMGTNAIVAVISYTGYDMEDAMILNKSSYERGFAHGCIFKSMFIELESVSTKIKTFSYSLILISAMMIECMAGKSAAVHGLVHDATPFKFTENNTAIDYFGKLLEAGGYNYYGTETMYSGVDGSMMQAQIFFGVVHYQRLRHMVSDKWQVRNKGPVDKVTHQPVKGRKRGGGVRFGEMERDGVLAHGASWVLLDRLFNSSDRSKELVCRACGSLLGPTLILHTIDVASKLKQPDNLPVSCRQCGERDNIGFINIPFVLRNLVSQLASFNIKVELDLKPSERIV